MTLFSTSCSDKYTITGTLPSAIQADSVYLYPADMSAEPVAIAAAPVVNGQFTFKNTVPDTITLALVHPGSINDYPGFAWNLILEKGTITLDTVTLFAKGTPLNDGLSDWMEKITPVMQMMMSDISTNCLAEFFNEHWAEHAKDYIGPFFLMQTWAMLDINQVQTMIADIPEELHNVHMFKKYLFEPFQSALELQPGKPFKDAQLQTLDGQPAKLSDFIGKGKYVLVDFWASWCGPCRQTMPQLKNIVAKHPNLSVLGIAIRDKVDETRQAIDQLSIPWTVIADPQVQTGQLYGYDAIPFMMLFDPEGKILIRGAHPDAALDSILTENNL